MIRAAVAATLVLAALSGALVAAPRTEIATAPLSISEFRNRVAAAIAAADPAARVENTGDRGFRIVRSGADDANVDVGNAYSAYCAEPAKLDMLVDRFARLIGGKPNLDEPVEQLVVIVRPTSYITANLAAGASRANIILPRSMAGDLSFFLAVDSEDAIRTATRDDLTRWRIDEAEAWRRAVANIKPRLGEIAFATLEGDAGGAMMITAESGLAPSMLAAPWSCGPATPSGGPPGQVILLYSREAYLIGTASDPDGMAAFWRTAKSAIAGKSAWSATPLTCRDGRWTVVPIP